MSKYVFLVLLGGNLGWAYARATDGAWFWAVLHALVAAYMIYERIQSAKKVQP